MVTSKAPRSVTSASPDRRGGRPGSVLVSVVSWALLGITLLVSRVGVGPANQNPVGPEVSRAIDTVGGTSTNNFVWWWVSYLPVLGVVLLLLVGVLFLGKGWVRFVVVVLGLIAIIGYAQAGQWHIVPATAFLVVGAVASVTPASHRYLRGSPATTEDGTATG